MECGGNAAVGIYVRISVSLLWPRVSGAVMHQLGLNVGTMINNANIQRSEWGDTVWQRGICYHNSVRPFVRLYFSGHFTSNSDSIAISSFLVACTVNQMRLSLWITSNVRSCLQHFTVSVARGNESFTVYHFQRPKFYRLQFSNDKQFGAIRRVRTTCTASVNYSEFTELSSHKFLREFLDAVNILADWVNFTWNERGLN